MCFVSGEQAQEKLNLVDFDAQHHEVDMGNADADSAEQDDLVLRAVKMLRKLKSLHSGKLETIILRFVQDDIMVKLFFLLAPSFDTTCSSFRRDCACSA